jgi:hypothetical protein
MSESEVEVNSLAINEKGGNVSPSSEKAGSLSKEVIGDEIPWVNWSPRPLHLPNE